MTAIGETPDYEIEYSRAEALAYMAENGVVRSKSFFKTSCKNGHFKCRREIIAGTVYQLVRKSVLDEYIRIVTTMYPVAEYAKKIGVTRTMMHHYIGVGCPKHIVSGKFYYVDHEEFVAWYMNRPDRKDKRELPGIWER